MKNRMMALLSGLCWCSSILAADWYVDAVSGADGNSGNAESAAKATIQAAVDASSAGDTIYVAPGTYAPFRSPANFITVKSVAGPLQTIIDGGGNYIRGNYLLGVEGDASNSTNTVVEGFTIQHLTRIQGGTIRYCIVRDNNSGNVGCAACTGSVVENSLIINNHGMNGAAGDGSIFRNCTISGNTARDLKYATLNSCLENCIVYGNQRDELGTWSTWFTLGWYPHREANVCYTDPGFVDATNGDYRLAADSPCVDAGDNVYVTGETDLDGNPRVANGTVDLGVYEYCVDPSAAQVSVRFVVSYEGGEDIVRSYFEGSRYNSFPSPSRGGYTFVGWFTEAVGGTQMSASQSVDLAITTLYAHWVSYVDGQRLALDLGSAGTLCDNGSLVWTVDSSTSHQGDSSLKSATISHSQTTWQTLTVAGSGTLSFWWKVSSEGNYDWLRYYVDGTQGGQISGSTDWAQVTVNLEGDTEHVIKWEYAKDDIVSSGNDCGWIDDVVVQMDNGGAHETEKLYMVIDLSGGCDAEHYPISYMSAVPSGGWSDEFKSTKMVLRRIEPGKFLMGSPSNEIGRESNEDLHEVEITHPFYIGVFEVTQRQWELIMGSNPSAFTNKAYYATRPVERVSYNMVRGSKMGANWPNTAEVDEGSFIGVLRAKTGASGLDLPTDAQWEYACRAGTQTALNNGANLASQNDTAALNTLGRIWGNGGYPYDYNGDDSHGTMRVGQLTPNAWGLYDMHGNADEWVLDWHAASLGTAAVVDPMGPTTGSQRVIRGGGWHYYSGAYECRSAHRGAFSPASVTHSNGLRLRVTPPQDTEENTPVLDESLVVNSSVPSGHVFDAELSVTFDVANGYEIHYTLDGTAPTRSSNKYDSPIVLTNDTKLAWFLMSSDGNSYGPTMFATYFRRGVQYCAVTLDTCGGILDDAAEVSCQISSEIGELPTPRFDGNCFLGWFSSREGGMQITSEYVVESDMTLFAHWVPEGEVTIVSTRVRDDDPTVLDVVYRVNSNNAAANVRALAFEDGEESFAKVIRPETFIDGTETNLGYEVAANSNLTLSWRVTDDWNVSLARVKIMILVEENFYPISLDLVTIPANGSHRAVSFSTNEISEETFRDALFWLYASRDAGLSLVDGVLSASGVTLANGTELVHPEAERYVFKSMGYQLLEGENLQYVNETARLGLNPQGSKQYVFRQE